MADNINQGAANQGVPDPAAGGQHVTQDQMAQILNALTAMAQNLQGLNQRMESMEQGVPARGAVGGGAARKPARQAQPARQGVPQQDVPPGEEFAGGGEGDVPLEPLAATGSADPVCGREGNVKIGATALPEITKWTFKPTANVQEYASNRTGGYKKKVCGSKTASGSLEGKWDRDEPITSSFTEGSAVTLVLLIDATRNISVPAIIKSLSIEVDINEDTITGWSAEFDADGAWTYNLTATA